MIYDCFIFFNELELLELRLHELTGVVDKFVLVESTRTFTNQPKPLHFLENRDRFSEFLDKIIHVVVDDSPNISDAWAVEAFQRNCISRGLTDCRSDDWVLVSDLDEIPRATAVAKISREISFQDNFFSNAIHGVLNSRWSQKLFRRKGFRRLLRKHHPFIFKFEQVMFRHFINCRVVQPPYWHGTRMLRFRDFSCAQELRQSGRMIIKSGGWHFTYMGGVERIRQKIAAYAHQEYNHPQFTDAQFVSTCVESGKSLFGHDERLEFIPLDDSFPLFIRDHPQKFAMWIKLA